MKTERRHELETNELAIRLGKITEAIQPRARAVVAGVVAVVAIVLIIQYTGSTSSSQQAQAWDQYASAVINSDTRELEALGEDYTKSPVGNWSRLMLADHHLTTGVASLFTDRAEARSALDKAIENYDAVRANASDELLKQRAHFGLGRANEALGARENLDAAHENYQAIVDRWPNSALAGAAQKRLDDIALDRTKEFYDWFAQQTPQAQFLGNEPGTPGARPDFDLDSILSSPPSSPAGDFDLDFNAPVTDGDEVTGTDATEAAAPEVSGATDDAPEATDTEGTDTEGTDTESAESGGAPPLN